MIKTPRSTPLRLSLALLTLFLVVSLATLAVAFFVARSSIESTIRDTLAQDLVGFQAAPSAFAVSQLVEARGRAMDPSERIIGYLDPLGRMHGNGAIVPTEAGFQAISLQADNDVAETYFALTQSVRGGLLTLAVSTDDRQTLTQTMLIVLFVSLLPTSFIALAGGILLSRRSAARLKSLETTLAKLTGGDLSARVPAMPGGSDDLKTIASRVDEMARAQEQSFVALKQVSSDIAHDLKTPIQRVAVLLEQARQSDEKKSKDLLDQALEETESMSRIFQALLQIAQLEGGNRNPELGQINLAEVCENIHGLYKPTADDEGHVLSFSVNGNNDIIGDKTLIGQALANLIENACRYGGSPAQVAISCEGGTLRVCDQGEGIPEDKRELVLRRLYRLDSTRMSKGSGLGLALVKAICDMHGAEISLSDNDPGLCVEIRFRTK